MPPRTRRPAAAKTTAEPSAFPSWDELVAEAHVDTEPYQLPLPAVKTVDGKTLQKAQTVLVELLDGERYLQLLGSQRIGDAPGVLAALFPHPDTRQLVINAMRGAPWPIVDVVATKVLRYFYGLDIQPRREETDGEDEELGKPVAE